MKRAGRKTVLVFGTFDLLHAGHRSFLKQAKRFGKNLIVAVGRDQVVAKLKRQKLIQSERQRLKAIASLPYVHRAILASKNPWHRFSFIKKLKPDIIALGYDQMHYTTNLASQLRRRGIVCRVVRLKPYRPRRFKSSLLRKNLASEKK
ncbi:MAG: FAD synthase [Candidatus Kerfeldbacteria bacterium]|nr:FAD synthase [Candidatus Kerfeldbacteria bacterium]